MYKMVVSDFYGTLINSEEAIALSTMIELDRIRKSGVLFTITTSKSVKIVKDYNRDFPFVDYVVAFNGSYIYDLASDKVVYSKAISNSTVKKIYKLFRNNDLCFYTVDYCNYTGEYKDKDYSEMLIDVEGFVDENKDGIFKIKICAKTLKEAKNIIGIIEEKEIKVSCYIKEEYGVYVVEVFNLSNSKFLGIKKICRNNKIKLNEVVAICSSESSLEVVSNVGLGVSVSNAINKIKKAAKCKTASNEQKGVEQVIKKYF